MGVGMGMGTGIIDESTSGSHFESLRVTLTCPYRLVARVFQGNSIIQLEANREDGRLGEGNY